MEQWMNRFIIADAQNVLAAVPVKWPAWSPISTIRLFDGFCDAVCAAYPGGEKRCAVDGHAVPAV
jgi:hypothetical protein